MEGDLLHAYFIRMQHIQGHASVLPPFFSTIADQRLHRLLATLVAKREWPEPTICRLIEDSGLGADARFDLAKRFVQRIGFTPEIAAAVKALAKYASTCSGGAPLRKRIDGFLVSHQAPTEPKRNACFGDHVRWRIAQMPEPSRGNWQALLNLISLHTVNEPSKKWIKDATPVIRKIGRAELEARLTEWFEMLKTGGPFDLSTQGSHLLRELYWCMVVEPPSSELARLAVVSLSVGNWKQTKRLQSMTGPLMKCAAALSNAVSLLAPEVAFPLLQDMENWFGYPEGKIRDRYLAAARHLGVDPSVSGRPNPYSALLAGVREGIGNQWLEGCPVDATRVARQRDHLAVTGDLDEYRVEFAQPRIVRASDGAVLTLDSKIDPQPQSPQHLAKMLLDAEHSYYLRFA